MIWTSLLLIIEQNFKLNNHDLYCNFVSLLSNQMVIITQIFQLEQDCVFYMAVINFALCVKDYIYLLSHRKLILSSYTE